MATLDQLASQARSSQRRVKIALIALMVLLFVGIGFAKPIKHWLDRVRAEKSLQAARVAVAAEDWPRAFSLLHGAAPALGLHPELLRLVADVQLGTHTSANDVVETINKLVELRVATSEDYLKLARAQLDRGDIPGVQTALSFVSSEDRQMWRAIEIETDLLLQLGRIPEAEASLRKASPDDKQAAFKLAVLDFTSGNEQRVGRGREVLWRTAREGRQQSVLAMNLLSNDTGMSAEFAEELLQLAARQKGLAALGLRYNATAVLLKKRPHDRDRVLDGEQRLAGELDIASQVLFLRFLTTQNEPARILTYLRDHGARLKQQQPGDYWNFRLEGLARTRAWAQVKGEMYQAPAQSLSPVMLHLWQACTAFELDHNDRVVREEIARAFEATNGGRDLAAAMQVASTAESLGLNDVAADYYDQLAKSAPMPADRVDLLQRGFDARRASHDTAALAKLARQISDLTPGHALHAFRADYLSLLTNASVEPVVIALNNTTPSQGSAEAVAQQRLLWAMIYARRKQTDFLRKELDGLENWGTWSPGERAVIAGLIAESGDVPRAWKLAEKIPQTLLLPEEAAMLAKAK